MKQLILIVSLILLSFIPFNKMNETDIMFFTQNSGRNIINPDNPDQQQVSQNKSNSKLNANGNISDDWYSAAIEKISLDEYNITYNEKLKTYQSPNRANNIRFTYHKDGFKAETRDTKIPLFDVNDKNISEKDKKYEEVEDWSVELRIENYELGMENEELTQAGNKASIENENIRIDYTNSKEGMRQDFIIRKKLSDENDLILTMNVNTSLKMTVRNDAVSFSSIDGSEKMQYASLKAWDANKKELKAYFESNGEDQFAIRVDDRDAKYPVTVDPISTSPDWTGMISFLNSYDYGYSVSSAGDINLDGYSDIIIGAPGYSGNNAGRLYVYYGSSSGLHTTEDWSFTGDQANARLGSSVSSAGDVNGDGFPDIIASAPYYTADQIKEGRVYVFYGSPEGLSDTAVWIFDGNKEYAGAGYSVSGAGDFNNDGFDDVIIGLPGYENVMFMGYGSVSIFLGSSSGISSVPFLTFRNYHDDIGLGNSVSCAGDVNGDGFSDVIFGSPYWPPPPDHSGNSLESNGRVSVIYGSSTGTLNGWGAVGEVSHSSFGYSVSTAGDVNNDGYSDVIIGSPSYYGSSSTTGKVYVYFGSSTGLQSDPAWTMDRQYNSNYQVDGFGRSVSTAGDINADGYSDIVIGAHYTSWDDQITDITKAAAYVYYGSSSGLPQIRNWVYNFDDKIFQIDVSNAGDVNGDGYSDVLLGINGINDIFIVHPIEKAMIFNGSNTTLSTIECDWAVSSDQSDSKFGNSVSTAGDVNNDGFDDVIIGAPLYDNGQTDEGKVFEYNGSSEGLHDTPDWTAEGNIDLAQFGYSVSNAGDVNNDGYSDIIIGAPTAGKAFVYLGSSAGLLSFPVWTGNSYSPDHQYGISVSNAGDVNGDGFDDIVIGTYPFEIYNAHNVGAYVYFGSASGINSADPSWTASNPSPGQNFGKIVSAAGDVNNDGFDDVIVSDFSSSKVFAYYGSANKGMFEIENWSAYVQGANNYVSSISDAGDVNGDGYGDIIISKMDYQYLGYTSIIVFNGSNSGLSLIPNQELQGNGYQNFISISKAGDFNNDGYSDIVVGEDREITGAYIFFGSQSGLLMNSLMTFNSTICPSSVSDAGDVNGDGIDDIIIGSQYFNYAKTFYGSGNVVSYFRLSPRLVNLVNNSELCITALLKDQYNRPLKGTGVKFMVKGANPDTTNIISDSNGVAKYCYTGLNIGVDTIKGFAGNMTDNVIAIWDYPLPVELSSFTSSVIGRDVTLNWSTLSELNNSGFEIEKIIDNGQKIIDNGQLIIDSWVKVGFVEGNGMTNEPKQYTFTDKNLQSGNYKYRLKQKDFNGNFEYFELDGAVSIGIPDKYSLAQNYPNPFNPVTNLEFGISELGMVKLKIYDVTGRELVTLVNEIKEPGYYTINFNAANLASGVYFYRMTAGEFVGVKKFIVLK